MTGPPTPERAASWFATLLSLTREGGPLSLLLALVAGSIVIYGLMGEVKRSHALNRELFGKLESVRQEMIDLAIRCGKSTHSLEELTVPVRREK